MRGFSVAISGDTALVGAREDDDVGLAEGSAYVFVEPGGGWSGVLTEDAKLTASDAAAEDEFGFFVAISGGTALMGAPFHDTWTTNEQNRPSGTIVRFGTP